MQKIPSFRSVLFWVHLVCGVAVALVVFSMSLTGVILTYERQLLNWSARSHYVPESQQQNRMSLQELTRKALDQDPKFSPTSVNVTNDPGAPVTFRAGRFGGLSLNPYTGLSMERASHGMESFFRTITSFHRWFSVEGEGRNAARWVTGVSNLVFLFLIVSGMYLWLPKFFRWRQFRTRLTFIKKPPSSKVRDYNWHHVFGIWAAIPLIIIVYTGSVFFFSWPGNLLNTIFGAEASAGGRGPRPGFGSGTAPQSPSVDDMFSEQYLSLDDLHTRVIAVANENWKTISINFPSNTGSNPSQIQASVDWGNGAQVHKRATLTLNRESGELMSTRGFSDTPTAQKVRGVVRFLHTGEIFGFVGQTIAGLVSLLTLIMVWTGLALSYRRLIQPLFKK